jgi:cysteine-rich repeat protein
MKRGRRLSFVVSLAIAASAHATINMTGRWVVDETDDVGFSGVWTFAQVGSALMQTPPASGQAGPRTGMIDSTSGAFTVSDTVACQPIFGPSFCTVSGMVAPDGSTFTGSESCEAATIQACLGGFDFTLMGVHVPPTCGNGVVDPGEQCDDGANLPGGCCDAACRFVGNGIPCGRSNCIASNACDGAGTCVAGPPLARCDQCSRCDPGAGICIADPATSCRAPTVKGAARLSFKSKRPTLSWKWSKGEATALTDLGDPVHGDEYSLCIYDESPSTLFAVSVPPGPSWRAAGRRGFRYKDKLGMVGGVTTVDLQAGAAGKAKVSMSAAGSNLRPPAVALRVPLTVQLRGHGECWGARYGSTGVKRSTASEFLAKSSPSGAFLDVPASRGADEDDAPRGGRTGRQ